MPTLTDTITSWLLFVLLLKMMPQLCYNLSMAQDHIQVTVTQKALITVDNKVLLVLQKGDWELPGGRVDKGETDLIAAIKRELKEELSAEINIQRVFDTYLFTKPTGDVSLAIVYQCELIEPLDSIKPQENEIDNWKLFSNEELKELKDIYPDSAAAIKKFIGDYEKN